MGWLTDDPTQLVQPAAKTAPSYAARAAAFQKAKDEAKPRTLDEALDDLQRVIDRGAERDLMSAAAQIRKADPSLTKEKAVAKALEGDPDLYASYRRHELRKSGHLLVAKSEADQLRWREALGAVEKATSAVLNQNPLMTQAKAMAIAFERNPSLYTEYQAARAAAGAM